MARRQTDLQKVHKRRKKRESLLETLESIVVAFVLAFIFRAFIVEAFVIPTGSMAATLNGAHLEITCPDCRYSFAMGYEQRPASRLYCPNCFLPLMLQSGRPVYSGDRLLVLKFLYDFQEPRRWDVVVFRNPNEPQQNYIKRLVALPGETIELVRGNVTIDGRTVGKPDKAQEALWMPVHDTRYKPTSNGWRPRWILKDGWQAAGTGFRLERPGEKIAWFTYEHRGPTGEPANIMDTYGYNIGDSVRPLGGTVCTDLGLRGEITAGDAGAVVVIELSAYKDRFRFVLPAEGSDAPARVSRVRKENGREEETLLARSSGGVLPVGRAVEVLVANVDCRLMLWVDGRRVATIVQREATPDLDPIYDPTPVPTQQRGKYDAEPGKASGVRVGARGGPVAIGYLRLDRDVYYTNELKDGSPGNGIENHPFTLRADEFFVLGDNSPKSFDCRLWKLGRPVVPRRSLVGKAFFVYWAAAGWRYGIPLAPDVTSWRFVH